MSVRRAGLRVTFSVALGGLLLTTPAAGHGELGAGSVALWPVVLAIALVGTAAGLGSVHHWPTTGQSEGRHGRLLATLALGLGVVTAAFGLLLDAPLAVLGLVAGGIVAIPLVTRGAACRGGATTGAVFVHRTVEGATLAVLATTGTAVGLLAAIAVVAHAVLESVAVGGSLVPSGTRRALLGVVLVHGGFLGGALVGGAVVVSLGPGVEAALLGASGATLLAVGTGDLADRG